MKINYLIMSTLVMISGCNESDSNNDIEVYISTGELQCQENGLSISVTKSYLLDANVEVKNESCGYLTQFTYAAVCGGGTGKLHVFTIDKTDSQVAKNIGFTIPDSSVSEDDYIKLECGI
ncbi:hypothetical protein JFJ09_05710 [Pseudoalteromonas arctica]|uniref:hypothetical protein n=2 Tax=Pseudoalteromonas TaxID=53246 RepID=UPI0018CD8E30|nr:MULTISPECIES: hypothetical protein [Pseudoalteromonas]MBH0016926.1 hypothetical protein [Pseudoalteromonas sp. NGC95]MBZ2191710.1 hypothetical protein [Pseudoalteromonas arctica]